MTLLATAVSVLIFCFIVVIKTNAESKWVSVMAVLQLCKCISGAELSLQAFNIMCLIKFNGTNTIRRLLDTRKIDADNVCVPVSFYLGRPIYVGMQVCVHM